MGKKKRGYNETFRNQEPYMNEPYAPRGPAYGGFPPGQERNGKITDWSGFGGGSNRT